MVNGIYYRRESDGYRVVEIPVAQSTNVPPQALMNIVVQVSSLNVRAAPETSSSIVGHVGLGTLLPVLSSTPEWYYVKLQNEQVGWVMRRFTAPAQPVSQG